MCWRKSKFLNYIMLFLYSYLQFLGASIWIAFSPITDTASSYYNASSNMINLFSLSFLILQLPMAPLSSYLYRRSYHWANMFAYLLTTVGVWLRVIAGRNIYLALSGQVIIAAMSSLTMSGCSVLSVLWFEESSQPVAVAIASSSFSIGAAYGLVSSSYFPSIESLVFVQAVYTSAGAALNLIFSRTRRSKSKTEKNLKLELMVAWKDKYLLTLILLISAGIGVAYAVAGVIYQTVSVFGISENQAGWIGFSMYVAGTAGGIVASVMVGKGEKQFVMPIRVFAGLSVAGMGLWAGFCGSFIISIVAAGLAGFGLFGLLPLGIQVIIEQNKYVHESITTNMIYSIAQALSVVYTYPIIYFYSLSKFSGLWLATIFTLIAYFSLVLAYQKKLVDKYKEKNESYALSLKSILAS